MKTPEITHHMNGRWLSDAYKFAGCSDDLSTQCGAIIVPVNGILCMGWNHIPSKLAGHPERLVAPDKYLYTEHAERSAIYDAARKGVSTTGATMYAPWAACTDCARGIIEAGIKTLVRHEKIMSATPERWMEPIRVADIMLLEAGVNIIQYVGDLNCSQIRFNGEPWQP